MPTKQVIGGSVRRLNPQDEAMVREIAFPGLEPQDNVPIGATGFLYLSHLPDFGNFNEGDILQYQGQNQTNGDLFIVNPQIVYSITRYEED